jgi:septal ring factor EnvC (AmiA/AmiB activator)
VEISALPAWKVRAPAEGTVRFAGPVPGFGNVLAFDHDEGYLSLVGHLGPLLVKVGERVRAAQPVASLPPAREGGPHKVYLELRRSGRAFDPIPWIQGGLAERAKRSPPGARAPRAGNEVVERE